MPLLWIEFDINNKISLWKMPIINNNFLWLNTLYIKGYNIKVGHGKMREDDDDDVCIWGNEWIWTVGTKHVLPLHNNRISVYCHDYYYYHTAFIHPDRNNRFGRFEGTKNSPNIRTNIYWKNIKRKWERHRAFLIGHKGPSRNHVAS